MQAEITRLRRQRHILKHRVARTESKLAAIIAQLADLEAQLRALQPQIELIRADRTENPFFARRELGDLTLGVLRVADRPLRRAELVRRVLAAKCDTLPPVGLFEFIHHRLPSILLAFSKRGLVERLGSEGWSLTK